MASKQRSTELVLVGGGHTHVQVLRSFARQAPPGARLTVVLDVPIAVYSGMVPGFVAGQYRAEELEIDVPVLARRAGAKVVLAAAESVDPEARRIRLRGRSPIAYDLASFDIGSTVAGLDLPGVRRHALPTRPIGRFVERFGELLAAEQASAERARVLVVGAGAGGVELAFAIHRRFCEAGRRTETTLLQAAGEVLPGYPAALRRRVLRAAAARGIAVRTGARVAEVGPEGAVLEGGERIPAELVVWVTGAAAHEVFRSSGLPVEKGFVRTRPSLQVEGRDELFAVGDCAHLLAHPETPKAGVYAVRQGPFLIHNLRAVLAGGPLRPYRPQKDFLTLLNLGDGRAVGNKWGLSFEGRWVMKLKDTIDRKFMRRFQVPDSGGSPGES